VDPAASLQQQAIDYAKRGDFGPDAKRVNQQLAELSPQNLGAWTRLARCCIELGQLDEATVAIDAALQLEPQNTIARNMQGDVTRRRMAATEPAPAPRRRVAPARTATSRTSRTSAVTAGFGRQEFTALAHLPPAQALEALGPRLETLLMDVNERPFAAKAAEARNRAGRSGIRLFRRNSFRAVGPGHLEAFQHGGRWEPQINLGWLAVPARAMRAGIGFHFTAEPEDPEGQLGRERLLERYALFQRLVASEWRELLTRWMEMNRGFIQHGTDAPATDLLPRHAVQWIIDTDTAPDRGWVFCGRWLFADRADDEEVLADAGRLIRWIDQTFTDLLPLWTAVYRG